MELYPNKKVTPLSLGYGLTPDEAKLSGEIYDRIVEEVRNGEHEGRECYYGGMMASVPTLEEVAAMYGHPLDRARSGYSPNCLDTRYTNVFYFFAKGRNKPLYWYIQK